MYAQYLPIYTPSEEEKRDPALFASNVRDIMAKSVSTSNLMIQIILLLNAWHVILIFVFYTFFFLLQSSATTDSRLLIWRLSAFDGQRSTVFTEPHMPAGVLQTGA